MHVCIYIYIYIYIYYKSQLTILKACVRYFYQIFIFSPKDNPSKTMKNAIYFI